MGDAGCMTLDGVPYIGQYSKRTPDFYVATGFNKWGMTGAMAAARILTDQITGKENPNALLFSPSRHMFQSPACPKYLGSGSSFLYNYSQEMSPSGMCFEMESTGTYLGLSVSWIAVYKRGKTD